jgi:hypothetical protein
MPFSARELSVLAYANGFTLWHYRTADDLAALLARDGSYFAAADELLRPGDQILLSLERGGRSTGSVLGVARVHPGSAVEVEPAGTLDLSAPDGMGQSCLHRSETAAGGTPAAV